MQILLDIPEEVIQKDKIKDFLNDMQTGKGKNIYDLPNVESIEIVEIGPGVDVPVILATLSVAWTIFKLPSEIKDGLERWKWLVDVFKKLIKKKQLVSLDLDAAGMLAIDYLADIYGDDSSFDLCDAHTINIVDISGIVQNNKGELADCPHNYFVFTFRIAGRIIILSVRSSGKIRVLESFTDMSYGLFDDD